MGKRQRRPSDKRPINKRPTPEGWDPVARWYDGWVGKNGSLHHRELAIPATLELLDLREGDSVLDVGCGQGVLAPHILKAKAHYTGVDVSKKLLDMARTHHSGAKFLLADARHLSQSPDLKAASFDSLVFLLSIQDIDPLAQALRSANLMLKAGGRVVILMTHPCFRIPRQSGWGWDEGRKLQYRRVDHYLTPLPIPMKSYPGQSGVTISFHRPLSEYINGLADNGLLLERMEEIPTHLALSSSAASAAPKGDKAHLLADQEIPLFLGLRAKKIS